MIKLNRQQCDNRNSDRFYVNLIDRNLMFISKISILSIYPKSLHPDSSLHFHSALYSFISFGLWKEYFTDDQWARS